MTLSEQIVLAARPEVAVGPQAFERRRTELPDLAEGQFLVAVKYLSIDPTIRTWMAFDTYLPKIAIGEVIRSGGAGEVIASRNPKYPVGTRVTAMTGWQSLVILEKAYRLPPEVSYEDALSVFGQTGLTAYVGITDIAKPQPGETVVVSGAAGAVGSIVGQLARHAGARVVGIAGGEEKCRWVTEELRFDACINYRDEKVASRLREECPDGVDVYWDNVGGPILNAVLGQIRDHARIVLCGSINDYDSGLRPEGPANLINAISRRALLQGFIVLDHLDRAGESAAALGALLAQGELVTKVDVREGLDSAPLALAGLFSGSNTGKSLVRIPEAQ